MAEKPLRFIVPPGIGDISWIYSKLMCLDRPLEFIVPHSNHDRALPYLELLPWVESARYERVQNPAKMPSGKVGADWSMERLIHEAAIRDVPIELNTWLEAGNRIEDFMPELPTVDHYYMHVGTGDVEKAESALGPAKRDPGRGPWRRPALRLPASCSGRDPVRGFVCLYCANRNTALRWHAWTPADWASLAEMLVSEFDIEGVVFLGAEWDYSFVNDVIKLLRCPYRNLVNELPIGATLHVIRKGAYLVAFPSGIPILTAVMECPVTMFYPEHLKPMQNAWAPKGMIESGMYCGRQFCPPQEAFEWIRDAYKLGEKIHGSGPDNH